MHAYAHMCISRELLAPLPPRLPFTEIGCQFTGRNCTLFTTRGELFFVMQSVPAVACSTLDEMEYLKGVWGHENSKDEMFEPPFFPVFNPLHDGIFILGFMFYDDRGLDQGMQQLRKIRERQQIQV